MSLPGASSSPEKDNFVRLCTLLVDEGTALLREIFDAIHPPATLQAFLSKPETTTKLTKGQLYKQEEEKVYPSGGGTATSQDFDITLLCKLLKNVCNLTPPTSKWKTFPKPEHKGQADDLVRIRFYRNDVTAHAKEMKTDSSEFERLWREISSAMIRLANHISSDRGNSWTTRIAQCRSRALTFKEEQYVQEVLAWEKQDRDVKEIVTKVEASVMILGQQVQTLTNIVTKEKGQGTIHIHIQGGSAVDKDGNPVPVESVGTIMRMIAKRYIEGCSLHDKEEHEEFRKYLQEVRKLLIDAEEPSSLRIRVRCTSLKILEGLWLDYTSGKLNEVAEKYLVTNKVLSECNLREMTLKTIIEEEEYSRCKTHLKEMQEPSSSSSIEESRTTDEVQVKGIKYCENILLGVGSQGIVYEGTFSGRKVAVKRMYKGPDEGNYVKDEAEKLKKLDHPNVIKCFEVEEDKEFVYLALEFCEKKLTDCVKQNDFHRKDSSLDGLGCLREITGAVAYLHERNICHRDINPDNILLSRSEQPRFVLADCNFAKNVHSASTVVGSPPGTYGYIAPELYKPEARITTKADLFSLGCVFYYVISSGRHLFGPVKDLKKCQTNILSANGPPTLEDGDFSQETIWTKSLIGRMLCYDPVQRPNATDVSEELEKPVPKNTSDPLISRTSTGDTGPVPYHRFLLDMEETRQRSIAKNIMLGLSAENHYESLEPVTNKGSGGYSDPTPRMSPDLSQKKTDCDDTRAIRKVTKVWKEGIPTLVELDKVARNVVDCWQPLGRQLGVTQSEIDNIQFNNVNYSAPRQKAFRMLQVWCDKGRYSTYAQLAKALCDVGKTSIAETYCQS